MAESTIKRLREQAKLSDGLVPIESDDFTMLVDIAEAARELERSAVLYVNEATFRVTRAKLDAVKSALSRLTPTHQDKEPGSDA